MTTIKQECIMFCIQVYNTLYNLWSHYSRRFNTIWAISVSILQQVEIQYYFKDKNEYPVPLYLVNSGSALIGINKCIVKENCCEWNTVLYDSSIRPKKYLELLAGTLYINNIEYEMPSNLLCIKSSSSIIPTYEQWIQVVYAEMNIRCIELPAKIMVIDDMGEERVIKMGLEFDEMLMK